jgi:hypothetical protein
VTGGVAVISGETVGRVRSEVWRVSVGRVVLTVLAAALYALGWLAAFAFATLATAVRWSVAAVRVGWTDGKAAAERRRGPA